MILISLCIFIFLTTTTTFITY